MKKMVLLVVSLMFLGSMAFAADEAELKEQMKKDCAPLFVAGAPCADLVKGVRNCVRENAEKGGPACVKFVKANKEFFDAGAKNAPEKKK